MTETEKILFGVIADLIELAVTPIPEGATQSYFGYQAQQALDRVNVAKYLRGKFDAEQGPPEHLRRRLARLECQCGLEFIGVYHGAALPNCPSPDAFQPHTIKSWRTL
jgi:hypothetical protein